MNMFRTAILLHSQLQCAHMSNTCEINTTITTTHIYKTQEWTRQQAATGITASNDNKHRSRPTNPGGQAVPGVLSRRRIQRSP